MKVYGGVAGGFRETGFDEVFDISDEFLDATGRDLIDGLKNREIIFKDRFEYARKGGLEDFFRKMISRFEL